MAAAVAADLGRDDPSRTDVPEAFRRIPVSAGVLFVEYNYPMFRAARQADEVRRSAKRAAMNARATDTGSIPPAYIDWWLNRQGAMIRPAPPYGGATLRPYPITGVPDDGSSWVWLENSVICGLRREFSGSRNKRKDLAAALDVPDKGESVRRLFARRPLDSTGGSRPFGFLGREYVDDTGFRGTSTPLRDAIELADIHIPLAPVEPARPAGEGPL
jgi:hypothetical protein